MISAGPTAERMEFVSSVVMVDQTVAMGAAWGVAAWSAYALVEFAICSIWPLFTVDRAVFAPVNWGVTSVLFNAYWVLGAVAGAGCATLANRIGRNSTGAGRARLAGMLSLYLAVAIHLLFDSDWQYGARTVFAVDALLLVSTAWTLLHPNTFLEPWVKIPPLAAAVLMLGPAWLGGDVLGISGSFLRRTLMIVSAVVILFAGRILSRSCDCGVSRHWAATLALLVLAVGGSAVLSGKNRSLPDPPLPTAPEPHTPPVVLVSFDTTRADHLSVYGYRRRTTPHLEELARNATLFTNAIAAADSTLPSHGSIFTGMYPSWHGGHAYSVDPIVIRPVNGPYPTLAEILRQRGIFTAGVAANKAFLSPEWGLGRGFESFNVQTPVEVLPFLRTFYLRHGIRHLLSYAMDTMDFDSHYLRAAEVEADAIGALEDPDIRNRPFFLFVNYMDAHAPYVAHVPAGLSLPAGRNALHFPEFWKIVEDVLYDRTRFPEAQRSALIERYDAGIAAEDAAFGDLVAWLKRRELYDQALIIVTADHGEAFGEHNLAAHGVSTYQDQIHVPLIVKYPKQSESLVVAAPVSHVDIFATVLDVLGIPIPEHAQGQSLRGIDEKQERTIFSESFPSRPAIAHNPRLDRTERAIRIGSYKFIVSDKGKRELFNLTDDPAELHNLTATNMSRSESLEMMLRKMFSTAPKHDGPRPENEDQLKLLRGLGYVR